MTTIEPLRTLIIGPSTKHSATVILMHGLGDSGHGWYPFVDQFKEDQSLSHINWILPHAPTLPVTANMGMRMPAWFDVEDFGFKAREDEAGMMKTVYSIGRLLTEEIDAGIPAGRIVIAGFSQGGAMTVLTGLTTERPVAGLAVMSGWAPLHDKLKAMCTDHARRLPIFWGHGKSDPLVKYQLGAESVEFLKNELGIRGAPSDATDAASLRGLSFHSYPNLGHSTNQKELDDLRGWLKKVLPKVTP
ncbi:Phospholipase/carboxylesterase [Amylostereum chailletii]|nr:Phospholipase/carboxylesterase [Amylostereum chailletii]